MAPPAYRAFLSHSGKDKDFVRELYRRLKRDGVSCFFDIESIGWGQNWVRALERALDECEFVVFVLSPDFCNSEWAEVERTSIAADLNALSRKVRPLMLRSCLDLPTFPRFLRQVESIDVTTNANFEANYPRICQELGGTPREDAVLTDRTKLPPVRPLPERHRMPYRSLGEKFVGRVDSFWNLHDSLFRDGTTILAGEVVVVGTGGLGKTQLAIEYTHRFGSVYTGGVYWVDADRGLSTLIAQVGEAAGIEVDPKADEAHQVEQIWRGLNRLPGPSLLILDNFPENVPLQPYLPVGGRVHTLITTRRQDLRHPSGSAEHSDNRRRHPAPELGRKTVRRRRSFTGPSRWGPAAGTGVGRRIPQLPQGVDDPGAAGGDARNQRHRIADRIRIGIPGSSAEPPPNRHRRDLSVELGCSAGSR
jgi:hypothetical protein